jgi:DNA-cytosine methyltransferase
MEVEDAHSYTANGAIVHNCQSISSAGKQAGFEEGSGTRSALLWECKKAIAIKHPKYLLMENVKAITQKKFMPFFVAWQTWLEEQGYKNFWQILNAKNYGVPQNRERCFMVSILDKNAHYEFPKPFELEKRLKDVLEEEVDEGYYLKPQQVERIVAHCDRKVAEGCGFKTNFTPPQGISGAIKTKEGSREYDTYVKLECEGGSEGERLTGREGNISTGNSTDTHERTLQLSEGNSAPPPEIRKQQTEQND